MLDDDMNQLRDQLALFLETVTDALPPGFRVTLVVRNPETNEDDLVIMTDDDVMEVAEVLMI